ncbi:MAG: hypothetical protein RLZ44_642, partial [Pseudomonadota bacterium]
KMCEVLRGMGYQPDEEELPDLGSCEIISTAEELQKIHMDEGGSGEQAEDRANT